MKYSLVFMLVLLVSACNQTDSNKIVSPAVDDTAHLSKSASIPAIDTSGKGVVKDDAVGSKTSDTLLMSIAEEILKSLKTKNFIQLASFVHPKLGVRFSPYSHIDTLHDVLLSPARLISRAKDQKILNWGNYDNSDTKKIKLNINKYFDRFVYDKDFINAKEKSLNEFKGGGNSLNNLKEVYQGYDFTEFYFPAVDPAKDYDWHLLRLVFKVENKKLWLVAIIHDEWTI